MLKKDKHGRFRKMSKTSMEKYDAAKVLNGALKRAYSPEALAESMREPSPLSVAPNDTRAEDAQAAIKRIVAKLSDSYELADVLVEIRNKLQRIADEAPPLVIGEAYVTREPRDERRHAAIRNLGDAIRNARRMETWRPKVDTFATVGDMRQPAESFGGPGAQIQHVVGTDRRRFRDQASDGPGVRRSSAGADAEDPRDHRRRRGQTLPQGRRHAAVHGHAKGDQADRLGLSGRARVPDHTRPYGRAARQAISSPHEPAWRTKPGRRGMPA